MDNNENSTSTGTPGAGEIDSKAVQLEAIDPNQQSEDNQPTGGSSKKPGGLKALFKKLNVYLVGFIFLLIVAGVIITIAYLQNKKTGSPTIKSQNVSAATLQQIANSDSSVGGPQQVLNVESSAVFAGKVLVRGTLEAADGLQLTGTLSIQGLNVSGQANLQSADIAQQLTVGGQLAVQGSATFNQGIQVNGTGTFSGAITTPEITTPNFQLNGNLVLTHHFTIGGTSPSTSHGSALGSGGTTSVSGSDTAGEVAINTGGGPSAGCLVNVTFSQAYSQTPYVILTPVGSAAGSLQYYINQSTTGFSVCTDSAPGSGASFGFDYFVVD